MDFHHVIVDARCGADNQTFIWVVGFVDFHPVIFDARHGADDQGCILGWGLWIFTS